MKGAMHHVKSPWDMSYFKDEDGGVVLTDARNMLNEASRKMMPCIARHEWHSGSRILFNLHRHHSAMVMRGKTPRNSAFLHSTEGAAQGYVLAMTGHTLLILPATRKSPQK